MGCRRNQSFRASQHAFARDLVHLPAGNDQVGTVLPDLPFQEVGVAAPGNGDDAESIAQVRDDIKGLGADRTG